MTGTPRKEDNVGSMLVRNLHCGPVSSTSIAFWSVSVSVETERERAGCEDSRPGYRRGLGGTGRSELSIEEIKYFE